MGMCVCVCVCMNEIESAFREYAIYAPNTAMGFIVYIYDVHNCVELTYIVS